MNESKEVLTKREKIVCICIGSGIAIVAIAIWCWSKLG